MINGTISHQKLTLNKKRIIVADTIAYLTAEFTFTDDWNSAVKFVHFAQGKLNYCKMLVDDKISEEEHLDLGKGTWQIYLHGDVCVDGEVKQRITTNIAELVVEKTGQLHGEPVPIGSPSVGEQILAKAAEAIDKVDDLKEKADSGEFKGDKGETGHSAYEVALESGFVGTEEQWLESLKGSTGEQGLPGLDGTSVTISSIRESTEAGGINTVVFSDGNQLRIKNGLDGQGGSGGGDVSDEDQFIMAVEAGLIMPTTDENGVLFTDEGGKIYVL